nr:glycosyltransferase family 2 protein [uncultured Actinotalea sp.]
MGTRTDILMITYRSPDHVRLSLPHLLSTCDEDSAVWLWHNGDDEETLSVVQEHASDPRVARFHHSRENVRLTTPTNWLWAESAADYVSKVDDDCLPEHGWIERIRAAHEPNPGFGAIGSWRFRPEDFEPRSAERKIQSFEGGVRLLRNHWVQGSGYLLPRRLVERHGPLRDGQSFTQYCLDLARAGAVNGWLYPFVHEENLDDPRSPRTLFRTDEDFLRRMPLTAQNLGIRTVADWATQEHESALAVQRATLDLRHYGGWRAKLRGARRRAGRLVRGRGSW